MSTENEQTVSQREKVLVRVSPSTHALLMELKDLRGRRPLSDIVEDIVVDLAKEFGIQLDEIGAQGVIPGDGGGHGN